MYFSFPVSFLESFVLLTIEMYNEGLEKIILGVFWMSLMSRKSHKICFGRTVDVLGSLYNLELTNLYVKVQCGNYFS